MIAQALADAIRDHWIVVAFIITYSAYIITNVLVFVTSRLSRTVCVLVRGWPPAHLDADGDPVPVRQDKE